MVFGATALPVSSAETASAEYTAKVDNFDISNEILDQIFNIARENKELLEAEKILTKRIAKLKNIS